MKQVEDWSFGYAILRPVGYIVHRLAHRNIVIRGSENIPKDEPVILAPNHQNALSDALAVVLTSGKQPVFLARADMFKNKLTGKALKFFKLSPVYRIRDGKDTLDLNQEVFEQCVRILKNKKAICIYPEAAHIGMKSMLAHKKAIPRIAFLAAENTNYEIDIKVVPVGIYYSHYYNFRRDLVVTYGEPLSSKKYYDILKEEGEAKASLVFRNDLFDAIRKLVVHVSDKYSYDLYDQGFEMVRPQVFQKMGLNKRVHNNIKAEQFLTSKIEETLEKGEIDKTELVNKAQLYKKLKDRFKLSEKVLARGEIGIVGLMVNFLVALILLPLSVYGVVANGWLFYLTHYSYRSKVKDRHFYSTIAFGLSFFIFPVWYIGQFFILHYLVDNWLAALGILIFSIPSGIIAWELGQLILHTFQRVKIGILHREKNKAFEQLMTLRAELKSFFGKSIEG